MFSKTGVDNTHPLDAIDKFIQYQPNVLGDSAGLTLGCDLEGLIQWAMETKKKYGDAFVSVEHLVLGYT